MRLFVKEKCGFRYYASAPEKVFEEFKDLANADQETLWMLGMNVKNRVKCKELISLGSLDTAIIYPRMVFKRMLMTDSTSLILVHNHPSGMPEPSNEDIRLTSVIKDGCKLLDMKLLDHVIIGEGTYFSFREKNLM